MQTANANTQVTLHGISGSAITTRTGKVIGVEMMFGKLKAGDIREAGRKLGLKGDKLTEYVNRALTDEAANRKAKTAVAVSALESAGYLGDVVKARKSSATITFTKPKELKGAKARALSAIDKMNEEEKAEVMAILLGEK